MYPHPGQAADHSLSVPGTTAVPALCVVSPTAIEAASSSSHFQNLYHQQFVTNGWDMESLLRSEEVENPTPPTATATDQLHDSSQPLPNVRTFTEVRDQEKTRAVISTSHTQSGVMSSLSEIHSGGSSSAQESSSAGGVFAMRELSVDAVASMVLQMGSEPLTASLAEQHAASVVKPTRSISHGTTQNIRSTLSSSVNDVLATLTPSSSFSSSKLPIATPSLSAAPAVVVTSASPETMSAVTFTSSGTDADIHTGISSLRYPLASVDTSSNNTFSKSNTGIKVPSETHISASTTVVPNSPPTQDYTSVQWSESGSAGRSTISSTASLLSAMIEKHSSAEAVEMPTKLSSHPGLLTSKVVSSALQTSSITVTAFSDAAPASSAIEPSSSVAMAMSSVALPASAVAMLNSSYAIATSSVAVPTSSLVLPASPVAAPSASVAMATTQSSVSKSFTEVAEATTESDGEGSTTPHGKGNGGVEEAVTVELPLVTTELPLVTMEALTVVNTSAVIDETEGFTGDVSSSFNFTSTSVPPFTENATIRNYTLPNTTMHSANVTTTTRPTTPWIHNDIDAKKTTTRKPIFPVTTKLLTKTPIPPSTPVLKPSSKKPPTYKPLPIPTDSPINNNNIKTTRKPGISPPVVPTQEKPHLYIRIRLEMTWLEFCLKLMHFKETMATALETTIQKDIYPEQTELMGSGCGELYGHRLGKKRKKRGDEITIDFYMEDDQSHYSLELTHKLAEYLTRDEGQNAFDKSEFHGKVMVNCVNYRDVQ